jgi:AcrR family transcriptional regulator
MSPPRASKVQTQTAERSRKTPAQRRAELVDAAAEVFMEKGYATTTVSDITSRAGSSHGTFYVYFDSKEDIFDAVAQDRVMMAFDSVKECADQVERPAIERIRDILKMNSEPEVSGWWVEEFNRSYLTHLRARLIQKASEMFLPVLSGLLKEAVREGSVEVPVPEATAAFLIAAGLVQRFGFKAIGSVTDEQWTLAYDDLAQRVLGLKD